jgi:hypothetical protein
MSCKKPFEPSVIFSPGSYLVVEGTINTNDTTTIKLSRTVRLDTSKTANPVTNASLVIECDNGTNYALTESGNGVYKLSPAAMDNSRKYRLRITMADKSEYLSDYEQAKNTPPIDSVNFKVTSNQLQLFVSSHDPANNTHYYRFDYAETWRFHVPYYSEYEVKDKMIVLRPPEDTRFFCFADAHSTSIVLGSTARLTQDVLYEQPVTQVASSSEKIGVRYSILVREYSLSAKEYTFWANLKKNTEQLGSIFDAEPTELAGNVHNLAKPSETVIGYVGAGKMTSKRIFIGREQLPIEWMVAEPYDCYPLDSLWYNNPYTHKNQVQEDIINTGYNTPVTPFYKGGIQPAGYTATPQIPCVDCTIRGYLKQPDFWQP